MNRAYLTNEDIQAMLYEDEDEGSDESYVPSDDDGEIDMILSDPESDYDSSSDDEDVSGPPADASFLTSRDGRESWSTAPIASSQGRVSARNIVSEKSGPTRHAARSCSSVSDCFFLFFRTKFLEEICKWTNKEGRQTLVSKWKDMTVTELKKLTGVLLLIGVYKSNHENVSQLWSLTDGRPIFNKIMSRNRFQEMVRVMRFDDAEARRARRSPDKLQPIRKVFEMWNDALIDAFIPGPNLTVDEQLLTFRGRCPFRQYIPSKPGKYGIKIWAVCDSATSYVLKMDVYKGKEVHEPRNKNLGCKVVMHLTEPFKKSGRNITCDNFFTSLELGRKLLKERLTLVGTIRKNRKELPPELVTAKKRNVKTTLYGFKSEAITVSYCPKKGKVVTLLSTMHLSKGEEVGSEKKPEVIMYYNSTKGGVDTMDQLVRGYSTKRMTRRWPMAIFYNMVDISALNAIIVYVSLSQGNFGSKGRPTRRSLLIQLGKELAGYEDQQPSSTVAGQIDDNDDVASGPRPKKRCYVCPSKKDRKTKTTCIQCHKNVCTEHSAVLCCQCRRL